MSPPSMPLSLGLSPFQLWNTDSSRPDLAMKEGLALAPLFYSQTRETPTPIAGDSPSSG